MGPGGLVPAEGRAGSSKRPSLSSKERGALEISLPATPVGVEPLVPGTTFPAIGEGRRSPSRGTITTGVTLTGKLIMVTGVRAWIKIMRTIPWIIKEKIKIAVFLSHSVLGSKENILSSFLFHYIINPRGEPAFQPSRPLPPWPQRFLND